jgi:hypothetical protein
LDFPIKEVILVQIVLEVVLLVLLVLVLIRTGRKGSRADAPAAPPVPADLENSISHFISESEKISETFTRNLEDKKSLSTDLIIKLDSRLQYYKELLDETQSAMDKAVSDLREISKEELRLSSLQSVNSGQANPAAPEVRALVLKLHKEGLPVEDIAVQARLHRGEVELIIDLENQFKV